MQELQRPAEKPTLDNSNATYANAIVNKIRQYNLYTSQLPVGVRVPDYKHSIIEDALERWGVNKNHRKIIMKEVKNLI